MKLLNLIRYALLGLSVLVVLAWIVMGAQDAQVGMMLWWGFALLVAAVALIVLLPLVNMIKNPKGAMRSMVGLAIVVVLFVLFYALGSGEAVPKSAGGFFEDVVQNKLSDAGLFMTYAAMAGTIIAAVLGEVRNAFK